MRTKTDITVLLESQADISKLRRSLESLKEQAGPNFDFDVQVIWPSDRLSSWRPSSYLDDMIAGLKTSIDVRVTTTPILVEEIRGNYLAFMTAGDLFSTNYLRLLLNAATSEVIPLSLLKDPSTLRENDVYNSTLLSRHESPLIHGLEHPEMLQHTSGKLYHRSLFDDQLVCEALLGDPLLFNVVLGLKHDLKMSKFPGAIGATYLFQSNFGDQEHKDFSKGSTPDLLGRLRRLSRFDSPDTRKSQFLRNIQSHELGKIYREYVENHKEDAFKILADSGIRNLPWESLQEPAKTIAILANYPPYSGTAGIVAAKRLVESGNRVDVISSQLDTRQRNDADLLIAEPYVRHHEILTPGLRKLDDQEIDRFIQQGLKTFNDWVRDGASYTQIYSRSMVPYSHFLAAVIKRDNPHLRWLAEFSDPHSVNVEGKSRNKSFDSDLVTRWFVNLGTPAQQSVLQNERAIYRWAELLPYFFADALLFTNDNQLELMLEAAPESFRDSIHAKSVVRRHPTLPESYYRLADSIDLPDDGKVRIAYFGNFYSTRGMREVLSALDQLFDEELDQLSLLVFTDADPDFFRAQVNERVWNVIQVRPQLDYLTYLATLTVMDCLVVNDAHTAPYFRENPYLPSKMSDYVGSKVPIWAIVEHGSVLSSMKFSYKSELGDELGATRTLRTVLRSTAITDRNNSSNSL